MPTDEIAPRVALPPADGTRRKKWFALFVCILVSGCLSNTVRAQTNSASPKTDGRLMLTLRALNYADAPIQILGLKHAEEPGKEPLLQLRNTSSTKTLRIWIEAIIIGANSDKMPIHTNSNDPNLTWPAERAIDPGADVWAHETVLRSDYILVLAKDLDSSCISVRIRVKRVDFVDGTSWQKGVKGAGTGLAFADKASDRAESCRESVGGVGTVELDGPTVIRLPHPEKLVNWENETSYSISCPVKDFQGKHLAVCPF